MKLTELIKKLQEYKKEIDEGCSHPKESCDNVSFVLVKDKKFNQSVYYTEVDYDRLENEPVGYCLDYRSGCHCTNGLTLVFRKEEENSNDN